MIDNRVVAVFGAYGHTGRFVVECLRERGWRVRFCGRDALRLEQAAAFQPGAGVRVASIDDAASLDAALAGCAAVLNCAGPFCDTAAPLIEAALRAGIHYLDTAAEQQPVLAAFERYDAAAREAGIAVVPAMAFYGGLGDLLASAALGDWIQADSVEIAVALDRWHPTVGTRITGERNKAKRLVIEDERLVELPSPSPSRDWAFPEPFGRQAVAAVPMSEIALLSRHLRTRSAVAYLDQGSLRDVRDADTPAPVATDAGGRSAQVFAIEARVRRGSDVRRLGARGRDIYAVTAPLLVEAMERLLDGRCRDRGTLAAGAAFDPADFLAALAPEPLRLYRGED
ncbi:saccharopine dehydrogenase NADP-binding domain-containing protein [Lysobacter yananisis]|uniref:Saccharopine dehydrogenase NADP-binding domain-containing protein n=1 Tax=Lysobacter yananisis TaxID=1003114 RepID=A0ABY9P475_9GAMM|nr:saccharopine dehydrogenase NADP-binding domain-containing protein [Lysobacter yananisis]WMT01774.1 saccharopine dehydrogenase NADP-binding domain-containing protein [Lysobacter yananisis]